MDSRTQELRLQATENGVSINDEILRTVEIQFQQIFGDLSATIQPTSSEAAEYRDWIDKFPRPGRRFYEQYAEAFNSSQFFKNLLKCLIACNLVSEIYSQKKFVIDLGSGAGPMSLAAITALGVKNTLLIDESAAQLQLAQSVGHAMSLQDRQSFMRAHISIDANFKNLDVFSSYWLSENPAAPEEIAIAHDGCSSFFVLDSPSIVEAMINRMPQKREIRAGSVRFSIDNENAGVEGGGGEFGFVYGTS